MSGSGAANDEPFSSLPLIVGRLPTEPTAFVTPANRQLTIPEPPALKLRLPEKLCVLSEPNVDQPTIPLGGAVISSCLAVSGPIIQDVAIDDGY